MGRMKSANDLTVLVNRSLWINLSAPSSDSVAKAMEEAKKSSLKRADGERLKINTRNMELLSFIPVNRSNTYLNIARMDLHNVDVVISSDERHELSNKLRRFPVKSYD
jgi:hypothetical protein